MNDTIEDAAQQAIREEAISEAEVACLSHRGVTVLHLVKDGCPLCNPKVDPAGIVRALDKLANAPAPILQVLETLKAIAPFTAQLGGRAIMAYGYTIADVIRLGAAQKELEAWINQAPPLPAAVEKAFATLTEEEREQALEGYCRHCLKKKEGICYCESDD